MTSVTPRRNARHHVTIRVRTTVRRSLSCGWQRRARGAAARRRVDTAAISGRGGTADEALGRSDGLLPLPAAQCHPPTDHPTPPETARGPQGGSADRALEVVESAAAISRTAARGTVRAPVGSHGSHHPAIGCSGYRRAVPTPSSPGGQSVCTAGRPNAPDTHFARRDLRHGAATRPASRSVSGHGPYGGSGVAVDQGGAGAGRRTPMAEDLRENVADDVRVRRQVGPGRADRAKWRVSAAVH